MAVPGLHVPPSATGGFLSIGNFDGVHRGHQAMLSEVKQRAVAADCPTVIVTFDPHPITVLRPDVSLPRLTSIATRTALLRSYGADEVVVLPVGTGLLGMQPDEFFSRVVVDQLKAKGIIEGVDFRFGKDRAGDCALLQEMCAEADIGLHVFPPVTADDLLISSTRIRGAIAAGNLSEAVDYLGHSYTITGHVGRGAGRGSGIGIPTANLHGIPELLPPPGVYSGDCHVGGGHYPVAVNIGGNPTFADDDHKVECHLIDFDADLYDQPLSVNLDAHLRDVRSFETTEALIAQIRADIDRCRDRFAALHG
ncbi:MAG: riboflavin biosynthesis protein RibF [Planctomycetaceae bacterium]|nr:riboflavin biosynthesis protein RibF [Planctomycetaceae bacterium]